MNKGSNYSYRINKAEPQYSSRIDGDEANNRLTGVQLRDIDDISFKSEEDAHTVAKLGGIEVYSLKRSEKDGSWHWGDGDECYVHPTLKQWRIDLAKAHEQGVEEAHAKAKLIKALPEEKVIFGDDNIEYVAKKHMKGVEKPQLDKGYDPSFGYTLFIHVKKAALHDKTRAKEGYISLGDADEYRNWKLGRGNKPSTYVILGKKLCNAYRKETENTDNWVRPSRGWRKVPAQDNPELQKKLVRQYEFVYEAFQNWRSAKQDEVREAMKED